MVGLITLISLSLCLWSTTASAVDHQQWDTLLKTHVRVLDQGSVTQVDYKGIKREHNLLKTYLEQLAAVTPDTFDRLNKNEQLAFLINAYNAWTIELILTKYPNIESIKDLGSLFQSPWKKRFIPLLGGKHSLDDIEHRLIRGSGRYNEPRIHFAVNCASIGCPALKNEAYTGNNLADQLEEATRLFLRDKSRNRMEGDTLKVSSIFKWYREDFEKNPRANGSLQSFLLSYAADLDLDQGQRELLMENQATVKFLDYDWDLNDIRKMNR